MIEGVARLFFAGELAGLLTCPSRSGVVSYPADRAASIKDVIEALGVPHVEVHAIRMDGRGQDFFLQLEAGAQVAFLPACMTSAYPVDVRQDTLLRPALERLRFLVDENVAGLVPLLRALGFDAAYDRSWNDQDIAALAAAEGRVVLSRDRALLKRSAIEHGRLVRSQDVDMQLAEVLRHYRYRDCDHERAFTRCLRCNDVTSPVDKADILHLLEPKTRTFFHEFRQCPACGRVYWRGTHVEKMKERFTAIGLDMRDLLELGDKD